MEYPITVDTLFIANLEERVCLLDQLAVHEFDVKTETLPWTGKKTGQEVASQACVTYINACANFYYKNVRLDKRNFTNILIELGGNTLFSAIHPRRLHEYCEEPIRDRPKKAVVLKTIFEKIKDWLLEPNNNNLFSKEEFLNLLRPQKILTDEEFKKLENKLNEGSFAAICYCHFRNTAIHELVVGKYIFSESTFEGKPVEAIGFPLLFTALKNILENFKIHAKNKTTSQNNSPCFGKIIF